MKVKDVNTRQLLYIPLPLLLFFFRVCVYLWVRESNPQMQIEGGYLRNRPILNDRKIKNQTMKNIRDRVSAFNRFCKHYTKFCLAKKFFLLPNIFYTHFQPTTQPLNRSIDQESTNQLFNSNLSNTTNISSILRRHKGFRFRCCQLCYMR